MSIYDNPSFYISIFSSICFVASEILPFVPVKGNGIVHSILVCLSSFNKEPPNDTTTKNTITVDQKDIKDLNTKLDKVVDTLELLKCGII